jgi:predicted nucleic acid-binding protein
MLLDSNIIIYSAKRENAQLRRFLNENLYSVSAVSRIEVLGYHLLAEKEREYLEQFFAAATVLIVSDSVVTQATQLRQIRRMSLGDAIIAGTALSHQLELVTRNVRDFSWIQGLSLLNPFEIS